MACDARAAYAADGCHQCHLCHYHRRRDVSCGSDRNLDGQDSGNNRGGFGRCECVRWFHGDPAHAGDVPEEIAAGWRNQEVHIKSGSTCDEYELGCALVPRGLGLLHSIAERPLPSKTAARGNLFGMLGMFIAVATTVALIIKLKPNGNGLAWVAAGVIIGGTIGAIMAQRVLMTKMPELVAFMHSMIGLAAVLIAMACVVEPWAFNLVNKGEPIPLDNRVELFLGTIVGAITFSGSVIAYGKLSGGYKLRIFQGAPVVFAGQHPLNLLLGLVAIGCGVWFVLTQSWIAFLVMTALAFVLGVLIIIPIGGADMPVVVSMLNSYSGWAAAGVGFSLKNPMLIIAGSLVGSSGAILSYIMCRAMNRSFWSVILGGFGATGAAQTSSSQQRSVKSGAPEDAAYLLSQASSIIIVPGYGLAVSRAQHALYELTTKLQEHGVEVRYAIHPVAGRMPGHMNVLLAEAEVPYEQVFEMESINSEFPQTMWPWCWARTMSSIPLRSTRTAPLPACQS